MTQASTEPSNTRELIVAAAARALLERGYAATTVRAIAAEAQVAIGNVQYYFPTKAALVLAAWNRLLEGSLDQLRAILGDLGDPGLMLQSGVIEVWDAMKRLGDVQLVAFDLLVQAPKHEELRSFVPEVFAKYRALIDEQLDRLEREGRGRLRLPREVVSPLLLNTVLGFGLYYVVTKDDDSCLKAISAFRRLAEAVVEPLAPDDLGAATRIRGSRPLPLAREHRLLEFNRIVRLTARVFGVEEGAGPEVAAIAELIESGLLAHHLESTGLELDSGQLLLGDYSLAAAAHALGKLGLPQVEQLFAAAVMRGAMGRMDEVDQLLSRGVAISVGLGAGAGQRQLDAVVDLVLQATYDDRHGRPPAPTPAPGSSERLHVGLDV